MKPVFVENTVQQLRAIIQQVEQGGQSNVDYTAILDTVTQELRAMTDEKDHKANLILLSILLLSLIGYLLYLGYYWPWLVIVAWVGAIIYYQTNEKSLSIATLEEKSKIDVRQPTTKINYLLAGISQKNERLHLVRLLNILFWPLVIFMGQLLLYSDTSAYVLWSILFVIATINAIFWRNYFAPQKEALATMKTDLQQLNNSLILKTHRSTYSAPLYLEEEE